jgi:hypothetical protein
MQNKREQLKDKFASQKLRALKILEQAKEDTAVKNLKKKKLYIENGKQLYQLKPLGRMGALK